MSQLEWLTIKGYKSIRELVKFKIRPLNVLIGANGTGKSNFLSAFKFLASVVGDNFPVDVQVWGGPDALLHYGRKITPRLEIEVCFKSEYTQYGDLQNGYDIILEPTQENRFLFTREAPWIYKSGYRDAREYPLGAGHEISRVLNDQGEASRKVSSYVAEKLKSWRQYHFHDTGDTALVKQFQRTNDTLRLKPDASNLAACLRYWAKNSRYQPSYLRIIETIRLVAPFFGDFVFRDDEAETIQLEWTERGRPDTPWKAHVLSDGTLRFICLSSLLLQPKWLLPDIIIIDEPELGLHPFAINVLAGLLKQAAEENQVIVSTQSVELLNAFEPEDIVIVERENNASVFKRLDTEDLKDWLEDYSLGELWKRNILGGRPKP